MPQRRANLEVSAANLRSGNATRRDRSTQDGHENTRSISFLNSNVSVAEFVDRVTDEAENYELNITKYWNQARARTVLTKDTPEFSGDPIEWSSFMTRFAETTKRCTYKKIENLEHMTIYMKGHNNGAVKRELHKRTALPGVLLFVQPAVLYSTLVNSIKNGPEIKADDLEILDTNVTK